MKIENFLLPTFPPAPPSLDYLSKVGEFPMYGNDVKGDCVVAAAGHDIQIFSANAGKPTTPDSNELIALYDKLSPNDDGLVMLDFLKYWRKNPIGGVELGAFASVNIGDETKLQQVMNIFDGIYVGALLPITAQHQEVWSASAWSRNSDGAPGSWGGHCIPFGKYHTGAPLNFYTCVTWGTLQVATRRWMMEYVDEAYVLIAPDMFNPTSGKAPVGVDMAAMEAYLKSVTA
jgi:hypothetical protein